MTTPCEIPCDIELSLLSAAEPLGPHVLSAALPFLEAVKVTVDVRVGRLESTVGDLLALRDGQVLTLDRPLDEPLDVLIDGHVVARGTLVAVGEHFGLRLTQAASLRGAAPAGGGTAGPENLDPTPNAVHRGVSGRSDPGARTGEARGTDGAGHADGIGHAVATGRGAAGSDAAGLHRAGRHAARRDAAGGAVGERALAGSLGAAGYADATEHADGARHADTARQADAAGHAGAAGHADAARHGDAARHVEAAQHPDAARDADDARRPDGASADEARRADGTGRAEAAWQAAVGVPATALADRA